MIFLVRKEVISDLKIQQVTRYASYKCIDSQIQNYPSTCPTYLFQHLSFTVNRVLNLLS